MAIQKVVCEWAEIRREQMLDSTRVHYIAHPRQMAMKLCREMTGLSYPQIGRQFGDRDHTTVLFAYKKFREFERHYPRIRDDMAELRLRVISTIAERLHAHNIMVAAIEHDAANEALFWEGDPTPPAPTPMPPKRAYSPKLTPVLDVESWESLGGVLEAA